MPARSFDHSYALLRDSVLAPFVSDSGVDYEGLLSHRQSLDRFIADCGRLSFESYRSFTRPQQMAFLINLYNAATLQLVLRSWPVNSIRQTGSLFVSPWTRRFIRLFDRTISLGQILHDILRPEFNDPRVHFALANASRGGPGLASEPYLPEIVEAQLDGRTEIYLLQRPEMNRFDSGELRLSPIFRWYENDFGKRAGVRAFVRTYFPEATDTTRVHYTEYDGSLNSLSGE
ncbi:DUF547 domain-containing protein [bacterium]|nr:DUF547 domain-containing protein [bacterium]